MRGIYFMIAKIAKRIQRRMRQNYLTFCLLVRLEPIIRRVGFWERNVKNKKNSKELSKRMLKSRKFYERNKKRITNLKSMLADEKSRMVWGGVIDYRTKGTPIKKGLYSEYDQYFVKDIIQIDENEVFVDCGAFIGDTIQAFTNRAKREIANYKIIAFEPDEKNYRLLNKFFGTKGNVVIIKKGLSDREGILLFDQKGAASSQLVVDEGKTIIKIPVINMDAVPECRNATWIKMDIEGAELNALRGAEEIIKRNHPKLTISIYHSDEDMIRIAEYIHELVPEYKLYIRQHTRHGPDTVLYAVI